MYIERAKIENFKVLRTTEVPLGEHLNVIVGDNECGKSTLLEAINLALTSQLYGRNISYELHPYLFNQATVEKYRQDLIDGRKPLPPKIQIELFFNNDEKIARMKGTNNSARVNVPGISFALEFNDEYSKEYAEYIRDPEKLTSLPVEYYKVIWRDFAGRMLSMRSNPIRAAFVDTTQIRSNVGPNRYLLDRINDYLDPDQRARLSLAYRNMKDDFLSDDAVKGINKHLSNGQGDYSDKKISVSLDSTSRASWEMGIVPHLDDIPFSLVGKGEQNSLNIQLAMDSASDANVYLIEEPENHQSHSNLNRLIQRISQLANDGQTILTTHNSFVLNKLGVGNVTLFNTTENMSLNDLSPDTRNYFMKLPGYDTLRIILSARVILTEGPSDELVVQRAYLDKHGMLPIEDGVEVISVKGLAFKRFLEISRILGIDTRVVTDNDGSVKRLKKKYEDFDSTDCIRICYDTDESLKTLEPQLLASNNLDLFNKIFETDYVTDDGLLDHMHKNKTDCALKIFESEEAINYPQYVEDAIQ